MGPIKSRAMRCGPVTSGRRPWSPGATVLRSWKYWHLSLVAAPHKLSNIGVNGGPPITRRDGAKCSVDTLVIVCCTMRRGEDLKTKCSGNGDWNGLHVVLEAFVTPGTMENSVDNNHVSSEIAQAHALATSLMSMWYSGSSLTAPPMSKSVQKARLRASRASKAPTFILSGWLQPRC